MALVSSHVYDICVLDIDESALCLDQFRNVSAGDFCLGLGNEPTQTQSLCQREGRMRRGEEEMVEKKGKRGKLKKFCGIAE